jgi:beta-glucosidase
LPWGQDAVIEAVAAANPNTIVVLETGNPVAMPWRDRVSAIVEAWYPGQRSSPTRGRSRATTLTPAGGTSPAAHTVSPSPERPTAWS